MAKRGWRLVLIGSLCLIPPGSSLVAWAQTQVATAGERYRSVRELKDIPATLVIPTMAFIANSLGVTCLHCHTSQYEDDSNPMKDRARGMIHMTRALNDSQYGGKPVITCETCHHGQTVPTSVPSLDRVGWRDALVPREGPPLPDPAAVLAHFREGSGVAAIDRLQRQRIVGTVSRKNGRTPVVSDRFELVQEKPATFTLNTPLSHPPEADAELPMTFLRLPRLSTMYTDLRVIGRTQIREQDTLILEGKSSRGTHQLYFDEGTGLLVRRTDQIDTPLGPLPEAYDFHDFRTVDGVTLPTRIIWSRADYQVDFIAQEVTHGGEVIRVGERHEIESLAFSPPKRSRESFFAKRLPGSFVPGSFIPAGLALGQLLPVALSGPARFPKA